MPDMRIFHLLVGFMLSINAQFSNAYREKITNPSAVFAYTASIHSLFVREPDSNDFAQYFAANPIFLGLHKDRFTLSLYESGAPYTFLTFKQRQVDFELTYAQTMIFNVTERNDVWHFRCIFSAEQHILDVMYSYLSFFTGQGLTEYRMGIDKVESYVKMDHMVNPIVETVPGLNPASLFDQAIIAKDESSEKIYKIAQFTSNTPRMVFRTGNFAVCQAKTVVVLKLSACVTWYHIFYFGNTRLATEFINYLAPWELLDIPPDVQSYIGVGLPESRPQSESESEESQPGEQSSPQHDDQPPQTSRLPPRPDEASRAPNKIEDSRWIRIQQRTTFTNDQLRRLQREFNEDRSLPEKRRQALEADLGLSGHQIKVWFKNKRATMRHTSQPSDGE